LARLYWPLLGGGIMSSPGCMQHGLRRTALGCALLAVLLLAPARATGSCGDYVTIISSQSGEIPFAHSEGLQSEIFLPIKHFLVWPFPVRQPCSGPECSSVPSTPPMAPAIAHPTPGEQAALAGPPDQLPLTRLRAWPRLGSRVHVDGSLASIFHPPRKNFTSL